MQKVIAAITLLVLLAAGAYYTFGRNTTSMAEPAGPATKAAAAIAENTIISEGSVVPLQSAALSWATTGTVAELLVKEGDTVNQGAPLARLDTRSLELQVATAEVELQSAKARRDQALEGNAMPQQIAAAQAAVVNAEAQLAKVRSGNVTAADIASAEAGVRAAQARLDALRNPTPSAISSAELQVRQAEINLQQTRDSASATKTTAELSMRQAVETLTQAQSAYSTALQQWQHVQDTGTDPGSPTVTDAAGNESDNTLNDNQRQQYYDAFVQAEATMRSAEQAVAQAKVTFEDARQQEILAVQQAEAQLADARVQLAALRSPGRAAITQQQAALDQARAALQKLQEGGTESDVAIAQAEVDRAQANLEQLTAPATRTDQAILEAAVSQAEQQLKQAELALEQATLRAPIAGTIASLNLKVGEVPSPSQAAIVLADFDHWQIETSDLTELSVVQIKVGDPATIRFDALNGVTLPGTVERIGTVGTNKQGDITYTVVIVPTAWDARLRWNMSATVTIEPE
jgi:HlyD family secretion protein